MKRTLTLVALLGALVGHRATAEKVAFTSGDRPLVYLVLDDHPDSRNREVVADFVDIIERATGAKVPCAPAKDLIPLYVGEPADFASLSIAVPALDKETSFLKVSRGAVYVLGGSSLGTEHGLYTLLRDLGFRWVMPGAIGECAPGGRRLSLEVSERLEAPDFRYRVIGSGASKGAAARHRLWLRRNRMAQPPVQHGHNLTATLAKRAPFDERPELYALLQGQRKRTQICTSNSESVALVTQAVIAEFDAHPELESYSLCPDDNWDFCECAACRALDVGHLDRGGLPSVSDRYQVFLNQVLAGVTKQHPSALVTTYSYNPNHTDPPQRTRVHPNTVVFATTSMFCCAHGVGDVTCPSRQDFLSLLREWRERTRHVYVYEYSPEPYCGGLPWPMWRTHARAFPLYKSLGIQGVTIAGQKSWAAYFPDYYVAAQMLWDSKADFESLFDDLLHAFFETAAPEMRDYYEALGSSFGQFREKADWGLVHYPDYFPSEVVTRARNALDAARKKTVTGLVRRRLEMVRLSFRMFDAYLSVRRASASVTPEEYIEQVGRLHDAIDRLAALNEDFLNTDEARARTGIAVSERFAQQQGFVNRWLLCGPFDNLGMDGHERVYPPEEEIDTNATYEGKGGIRVQWRRNRTPKQQGYVDLCSEYDANEWVCAYALCWITVADGPRDVLLRIGSNDSVKAFLNGQVVWDHKVERVASVDDDRVAVTLPAEVSTLLLKVGQAGLGWGFYVRITERDTAAVPAGIRVSPCPPDGP